MAVEHWKMIPTAKEQSMIDAIRSDAMVGRGSCTSIDEAWGDQELIETFQTAFAKDATPQDAVEWARRWEQLRMEMAVEYESPTAMARLVEWEEKLAKSPIAC